MSFAFGSGEVAPLFEGVDTAIAHPSLAEIRRRMPTELLPAFVHAVRPVRALPFGEPLGEGWRYALTLAPLPSESPYAVGGHMYTLHLTLPPAFPALPPVVRFTSILPHSQIDSVGIVPESLLEPRWEADSSSIWDIVEAVRHMLLTPMSSPELEEERAKQREVLTDVGILAFWRTHEPDCSCLPGRLLPCSFEELSAISDINRRKILIDRFRDVMLRRHLLAFEEGAAEMKRRLEVIQQWEAHTTLPELVGPRADRNPESVPERNPADAAACGAASSTADAAGKSPTEKKRWRDEWFDPAFLSAIRDGSDSALRGILRTEASGIFSFPMFTADFCALLMRELRAYEESDLPKRRPNSMNNYGQILNEMGLEEAIDELIATYVQPFVRLLYLRVTGGHPVDHHHTFVVEYKEGRDVLLDMHTDDSEVTVNVNLCDKFEGSGLSFCGLFGTAERRKLAHEYEHELGRAVIHAGLQVHGADVLEKGERHNLIIWCRSSAFRMSELFHQRYERPTLEEEEPDRRCLSKTHDRDYDHWATIAEQPQDP